VEEPRDEIPLDETETPDGALELVAYRANEATWIGIRPKGGSTYMAIGLHTGSTTPYIEATASIRSPAWGVAFGAVAPEILRAEVRAEEGEVFPARIIPLPGDFDEEYRAAWGIATWSAVRTDEEVARGRECRLVGHDARERVVEGFMDRPRRRDLSAEETLQLIQAHCDNGMRYATFALKQMASVSEQTPHVRQMESVRRQVAQVLAFVEGADDARAAMSAGEEIIQRYIRIVDEEGWRPPRGSTSSEDVGEL
jgi:hypothetical protein